MQNISRRQFAAISLAAAAGLMLHRGARAGDAPAAPSASSVRLFEWKELSKGVWVAMSREGYPFGGGNTMLAVGASGAMLVDTKFTAYGRILRIEAEEIAGRTLSHMVNTHHHADHTGGNSAFGGTMPRIAHENAKPRIEAQVDQYLKAIEGQITELAKLNKPETERALVEAKRVLDNASALTAANFAPTETMKDSRKIELGKLDVALTHIGPGHTDNDVFIHLPEQNIIHTGDLCFNNLHPFIDGKAGATTRGWQKSLDAMMALCNDKTQVIPGHGPITDKAGLQKQRDYWDKLREKVKYAKDVEGMKRDEVTKLKPGGFDGYGFEQMLANALGVVFDELSKGE